MLSLFEFDEEAKARNVSISEKFYVLQNIVTLDILEISRKHYIPAIYTYCSNQLKKINTYKSPFAKLQLIQNILENITNIFTNFAEDAKTPSAEDIFPIFIYILLQANPDNLYLNLE